MRRKLLLWHMSAKLCMALQSSKFGPSFSQQISSTGIQPLSIVMCSFAAMAFIFAVYTNHIEAL